MIQDTEKLYELINECKIRRLTTQESLDYIKKNGIKLSERTYRRYKKEVEDKTNERILEESEVTRNQQILLGLDSYRKIEKERWNLFDSTKNESIKARTLDSLEKLQERIHDYYQNISLRSRNIRREMEEEKDLEQEYKKRLEGKKQQENQEYWKQRIKDELEGEEVVPAKSKQKTHAIPN